MVRTQETAPVVAQARGPLGGTRGWSSWWNSPLSGYYLVLGSTVALAVLGLTMVLSSSSVESLIQTGSSYTVFDKQAMFAAIAMPLAWGAARMSLTAWKRLAWPLLGLALLALLAVFTPLGFAVQGNRNWLSLGGFTMQPSEAAKLALVVWSATVLEVKRSTTSGLRHRLVPVVPAAALVVVLVLGGHDLGTSMVLIMIAGSILLLGGVPLRFFVTAGGLIGVLLAAIVAASPNRSSRFDTWLHGGVCTDYYGACWQSIHGDWALATGGWWGVGLGASREKWSWLPEAYNDFILAIIGEELGLIGSLTVLALFALLGLGLFRVAVTSEDLFAKIATGGVLTWVLGQALLNIGGVVGLLPVIGVPMPLVSSGGSALVTILVALAMVMGFARHVPGAQEALAARPAAVRSLAVLITGRTARRWRRAGHRS
jgi:cell division protein FtsW